ncbi:TPA: RecE family exodeoxyribonuclease [Salmonella enterica subsp. enterica serovar Reading]
MKNIRQLYFKAKKSTQKLYGINAGTIHRPVGDDPDEDDALDTLAIKEAGFRRSDFFKPVRVDHLVVDDMPAEGVFDTAFCDRYKLAEDGKSWLLPAAQPESTDSDTTDTDNQEQGNDDATNITDSGDTANAGTESVSAETVKDAVPAYEFNVNGEPMADVEKEMLQPVVRMDDRHRILSQFILEDKFSHNITPEQLAEVSRLELDVSDNYIQDMLLATRNAPAILKLNTPDLWKYTDSFKKVFARDKRHPLSRMINFNQAYADAHPIDRGLLVQEWIKGNYISRVENSGATSVAPEPQQTSATKTDVAASDKPATATKTTYKAVDIRIGCALTKGEITYPITARVVEQGKAVVEADNEEFKRWSATCRITENIQFYDEKTHIEMIRQAPREVVTGSPELRRAYVDNYLAAYGTLDPEQIVFMPKRAPVDHEENMERVRKAGKNLRDMAAGRFKCDEREEKPQSEDVLADKPATAEAVEPDANEHRPDTRSMATESSVTADSDKTPREQFSEQLAADRGDFVPGISDPNEPKWIHNDYSANASASNEGEKTEVGTDSAADTADYVDHSEEFLSQPEPETEPKNQKTEPVTKVADGVFDVSAFFADTSNQGEKTEVTPPNNDVRSHELTEEKATDAPATTESLLHEIVRLQSINNQLLEEVISGQQQEGQWREDVIDSLLSGMRGFVRTLAVWGDEKKGRDDGEKLHKSGKGRVSAAHKKVGSCAREDDTEQA